METPLFDESCIRITGVHASGMCGIDIDLGRNGLSTCVQMIMRKLNKKLQLKPNVPTIGPKVGSGGRGSVVLVRGVMDGEVGDT
jgi:hypothetical protein